MACLDDAIKIREKMLDMFVFLSEENKHLITNEMIANYGGKYMLYYSRYISQLNLEDDCIIVYKVNRTTWYVKVNYTNIRERGVYSKFLEMREAFDKNPALNSLSGKEIEALFKIKHKTFLAFKSYYTFACDKQHI